jgi:hypothetical protein
VPVVSIPYSAYLDVELEVDLFRFGNSSLAFLATSSEGVTSGNAWQCISSGNNYYFANAPDVFPDCGTFGQLSVVKATSAQIPDSVNAATDTFLEDNWTAVFDPDVTCTRCSIPRGEYSYLLCFSSTAVLQKQSSSL